MDPKRTIRKDQIADHNPTASKTTKNPEASDKTYLAVNSRGGITVTDNQKETEDGAKKNTRSPWNQARAPEGAPVGNSGRSTRGGTGLQAAGGGLQSLHHHLEILTLQHTWDAQNPPHGDTQDRDVFQD